tara:strand:- start:778 stop:1134 length:357 start_codon:yes stop_codon:yes gene_type:complete
MRTIILLLIILVSCGPINIGVKDIPIKSKEIKGYDIKYFAKRDKHGLNCNAYLTINRKNSDVNELYIEIQALDKEKAILSVVHFLIKDLKKNEIIEKKGPFRDIKSCANIEELKILGG